MLILSGMTQELAHNFEWLCRLSFNDPMGGISVIPLYGDGSTSVQPLTPHGPNYTVLLKLQAAGLMMSITEARVNLKQYDPEVVIEYAGQRATLRAREGKSLGFHRSIAFSPAGQELHSLIAIAPINTYTAAFKDYLDKRGIDFIFPEDDD